MTHVIGPVEIVAGPYKGMRGDLLKRPASSMAYVHLTTNLNGEQYDGGTVKIRKTSVRRLEQ